MSTPIENRDLTKQPPHSPRDRIGGFAIIARTTDKCRASINGTLGEYHYNCPLDNMTFGFKAVDGEQFKSAVAAARTYEDVARWLQSNGTFKTPEEIQAWSGQVEALKLRDVPSMRSPDHRSEVESSCRRLGLEFDRATLFEWLEADDQASFQRTREPLHSAHK